MQTLLPLDDRTLVAGLQTTWRFREGPDEGRVYRVHLEEASKRGPADFDRTPFLFETDCRTELEAWVSGFEHGLATAYLRVSLP
jgi:hypothetical protein